MTLPTPEQLEAAAKLMCEMDGEYFAHFTEGGVKAMLRNHVRCVEALRQVMEQDNGGKTGWPPGMLQDDSRELSEALANKPDAKLHAREAAQAIRNASPQASQQAEKVASSRPLPDGGAPIGYANVQALEVLQNTHWDFDRTQVTGSRIAIYPRKQSDDDVVVYIRPARVVTSEGEVPRMPDGYVYRYQDGIRHNHGQEVNGSKPLEAIPYFYGTPAAITEARADATGCACRWGCANCRGWPTNRARDVFMTEFGRLLEEFENLVIKGDYALSAPGRVALIAHARQLEEKAAKFDALVAACEREDAEIDAQNASGDGFYSIGFWDAIEARKAVMK